MVMMCEVGEVLGRIVDGGRRKRRTEREIAIRSWKLSLVRLQGLGWVRSSPP